MKIRFYYTMLRYGFGILLLLICISDIAAQDQQADKRSQLHGIANDYAGYYSALVMQASLSGKKFAELFTMDTVTLINDFSNYMPAGIPSQYYDHMKEVFISNRLTDSVMIRLSPPDSILYACDINTNVYYIFLHKLIVYKYGWRQVRSFSSWEVLSLRDVPGVGLRIFAIHKIKNKPSDNDMDGIPNRYDFCEDSAPGEVSNLYGCPMGSAIPQVNNSSRSVARAQHTTPQTQVNNQPSQTPQNNSPYYDPPGKYDSYYHEDNTRPPSYRFAASISGGSLVRGMNNEPQSWNWTAGIDLHWYIYHALTMAAGYQYLPLLIDRSELDLHLFYASLGIGKYQNERTLLSFEPLIGQARSDLALSAKASLTYPPFLMWGAKGILQLGLGAKARSRLLLTAYYLQGQSKIPIQIGGGMLGYQINIHRPWSWREKD